MIKLVLLRHGQSFWNLENRFTGWTDVGLSQNGVEEAKEAGNIISQNGIKIDFAFVSVLLRAEQTYQNVCVVLGYKPRTFRSWKLNERHYGALQGLNKKDTEEKFGKEQVKLWRRSYDTKPPLLEETDPRNPKFDELYAKIKDPLPLGESLADTATRVVDFYEHQIKTILKPNTTGLVVAHGNSLRALIQYLDKLSSEEVLNLEVPTGKPIVYELDDDFNVLKHYYL
jgi:2,3-bisphosphoglycerate-dependent phosphoglycerate mutase